MKHEKIMQEIMESKDIYDSISIPNELDNVVADAIKNIGKEDVNFMKRKNYLGRLSAVTATIFVCFIAGLNTSSAFAAAVGEVPVLGAISKILTFRTYDYEDGDKAIHMEIPVIEEDGSATNLESSVNKEITASMNQYKEDAEKRIEEYKEAFIATGGTEVEFSEKEIKVDAGYQVFYETEDTLSFAINANENWSGAYGICQYYNMDLKEGRLITLMDLLGENFAEIADNSIRNQMKERMDSDKNLVYWDGSNGIEDSLTIDGSTNFYINKKGNPVIVFDKYEIAAGAFGRQEFEIQ